MSRAPLNHEQRALADAALANKLNVIHHAYVDISGDMIAGALLGQILYWFGADRNGQPRARIRKHGFLWIAKRREDWWDEIRISAKQYDRAAKILAAKGFIELRTFKFAGNPTTHIRIIPERLNNAIDEWKMLQVAGFASHERADEEAPRLEAVGFSPMGNNALHQTGTTVYPFGGQPAYRLGNNEVAEAYISLTETTAKNTIENTKENTHIGASVPSFAEVWRRYPKKTGKAKAEKAYLSALAEGVNGLTVLVEAGLYSKWVNAQIEAGEMERRYIPAGGTWFGERRWEDETPSVSSSLGFDEGLAYNRAVVEVRRLAREAQPEAASRITSLLDEMPY